MYLCSHTIYNITPVYDLARLGQWPDTGGGQFIIKYSCHHTQPEWRNQYRQSCFQSGTLTSCFTILVSYKRKSVVFEVIFQNGGVIFNLLKCWREKVRFSTSRSYTWSKKFMKNMISWNGMSDLSCGVLSLSQR